MDKNVIKAEQKRLEVLLDRAGVPKQQRDVLEVVIENMAWMKAKLDEAREAIRETSVAIPYKNGTQTGIHENPLFKGYHSLWKSYMAGLEKFTSYLPKELQEEAVGNSITVLEQVRQMKKAKA